MWKSKRGRKGSESGGSISIQPLLEDDKLYLPDSDIYVTTTKSGKPAIARKKNRDVLRDHGFDVLGQSFGVPSRGDFHRGRHIGAVDHRPRSQSAYSTPTPRVTEVDTEEEIALASNTKHNQDASRSSSRVPVTPRSILRSNHIPTNRHPEPEAISPPRTNKMGSRTKPRSQKFSRPATSERTRFTANESDDEESSPVETNASGGVFYTPLASPPFQGPTTPLNKFYQHTVPGMYPQTAWPTHSPNTQTTPTSHSNLSANLPPQQAQNFGVQFPSTTGNGFAMPSPTFVMPQAQPVGIAATYPQQNFIPPPGVMANGINAAAVQFSDPTFGTYDDERIKKHFDTMSKPQQLNHGDSQVKTSSEELQQAPEAGVSVDHDQQRQAASGEIQNDEKKKRTPKHKSPPNLSIMHMHICAGCGKTRSKGYHMTHPLKKGEKPEPDYCRRCITNAEYTDSEATDSAAGKDYLMTPALPVTERWDDQFTPTSELQKDREINKKDSRKNHTRRSSLLKAVSSVLPGGVRRKRAASLSTPEEASSRGSSPTGQPRVYRRPDSRTSRQSSNKASCTQLSQRSSMGKHPIQRSPGAPVTSLSSSVSTSLDELTREDTNSKLAQSTLREQSGGSRKRFETDHRSETWYNTARARNFSYKSSPLLPPTSSVHDHNTHEQDSPQYQRPVARSEASELSERRKDKRSKDSRRGGSSKTSNLTKVALEVHEPAVDGVGMPPPLTTNTTDHEPGTQASSERSHRAALHSKSRRSDSLASQSIGGWDTQGLFSKAPNFDEFSNNRQGDISDEPSLGTTNNRPVRNKSRSTSQKTGESIGYKLNHESLRVFDQASNLDHPSRDRNRNLETDLRSMTEHEGSRHDNGASSSSKSKTSRKNTPDHGGVCCETPGVNNAWDVPLPGSDNTRYSHVHGDSSSKHSGTKSGSHNFGPFDHPEDHRAAQNNPNPFELSAPEFSSANVFCTWDERGADSEPELLSPANDQFDSMPATPAYGWDEHETEPQVRHDSWEYSQSHFEQQAEQMVESMVEEDLLRAGKHSGLFGLGFVDGSATSTFPTMSSYLSHLTVSRISIESCASDEERNDGNAHYELSNESDLEDSAVFNEEDVKQIEFSGHHDASQSQSREGSLKSKSRSSRTRPNRSATRHAQTSFQVDSSRSTASGRNNMYEQPGYKHKLSTDKSSLDFIRPTEGSSILAHTGHSEDNVGTPDKAQDDKSTTSSTRTPRRRIRRFGLSQPLD